MSLMMIYSVRFITFNISLEVVWMFMLMFSIFGLTNSFVLMLSLSVISCLLLLSVLLNYTFYWGSDSVMLFSMLFH